MPNVDRRQFLKLVGAGGVGAGAGFMLAESARHPVEHLIPYPVPPEEYSAGIATWYNSVCGMCPAGCGITVRTREGRPKKIEGNPLHPVNEGRLCALGQAGLQVLYNPDRLTGPLQQLGERGSSGFVDATWRGGLDAAAERIDAARNAGNRVVFLSGGVRGHLAALLETFTRELGSGQFLQYEFAHPHALHAANRRLFGIDRLPYYDIANADYVLSFGADFLNNWLSPVNYSLGFGRSRQEGEHRGRFVQVEARMSLSGAAADEWIPARPGTEGVLALALAQQLVANAYAGDDADAWRAALQDYTPERSADITDVPVETIEHLASALVDAGHALAIGGGSAAAHTNGADTLLAVNALNYLLGNVGRRGGMVFNPDPAIGASDTEPASYRAMEQLAADARAGAISVLVVSNANPLFNLPAAADFAGAIAAIPTVISLSSFMDETTALADLVLPSHTYLESWGDDAPDPGVGFTVGAVSQPVVSPLFDTRATGDIVLELGRRLGLGEAMPWPSFEECVKDGWRQLHAAGGEAAGDFDTFWRDVLRSGVWGTDTRAESGVAVPDEVIADIAVPEPQFAGSESDYPFVLQPYLSTGFYDGRGANLPWMQELPDPMTSVVYGSWLEMNPETARELGLRDGDLARVTSGNGAVEVPVVVYPAIRPDVVAMPIGQGHAGLGRYAENRGANPIELLAPSVDTRSGALATGATRVSVAGTGRRAEAVKIGGESRELGRNIIQRTGTSGSAGHSARLNSIPIVVESS